MLGQFAKEVAKAHSNMLSKYLFLPACFDFDGFFSTCKCASTDKGITKFRVFEFKTKPAERGRVFLRMKRQMDGEGPMTGDGSSGWVQWRQGTQDAGQFWPNVSGSEMAGAKRPELAPFKDWADKFEVKHKLRWFANVQRQVHIASADKERLLAFVESIPDAVTDGNVGVPDWPAVVAGPVDACTGADAEAGANAAAAQAEA